MLRLIISSVLFTLAIVLLRDPTSAEEPVRPQRKVALVVGVTDYLHDFGALKYTGNDATELAKELRAGGFDEVVVLTDPPEGKNPATRENILAQLQRLTTGQADKAKNIRRGDLVFVALSGHGIEAMVDIEGKRQREAFFAPIDGRKNKAESLVRIGEITDLLAECGSRNLLLVDACREFYDPNKGRGVGGDAVRLRGQTAIMFACSASEMSFENAELKQGIFTDSVLQVLRESRKANKPLTWSSLVACVEARMMGEEVAKLLPRGQTQTPVVASGQVPGTIVFDPRGSESGVPASREPKADEEREVEIVKGVKMMFCWIPAGKATLGSPEGEKEREENEVKVEFETKGFWMGKYEVTQAQYEAVVGVNPSYFCAKGGGAKAVKGKDTSRFPVEEVSWDDCNAFLKKLGRPGEALGRGAFVLPKEYEWEYACRGGNGRERAFYFGNILNGDKANCHRKAPYGTTEEGPYLERTSEVGSYSEVKHPWGLCDMCGNVWEWCQDYFDSEQKSRVLRGGSWDGNPAYCRSAFRDCYAPASCNDNCGFRLVVRLD